MPCASRHFPGIYKCCITVQVEDDLSDLAINTNLFIPFSGAVHLHDVRIANHHVGTLTGHTQEVCGMQWSPDSGRLLATGGNDNQVTLRFKIQ